MNFSLAEYHIYGSSALGRFASWKPDNIDYDVTLNSAPSSSTVNRTVSQKEFEVKDHLGNVRLVFSDQKDVNIGTTTRYRYNLDVRAVNNYYPFGMLMPDMSWQTSGYRYGFGSHENDNDVKGEGNHSSFGDYGFDPRVGRRMMIEPMIAKYPSLSPYVAYADNPILFTDPDGEDFAILIDKEGAGNRGHMAIIIENAYGDVYYLTQGMIPGNINEKLLALTFGTRGGILAAKIEKLPNESLEDILKSDYNSRINESVLKLTGNIEINIYDDHLIFNLNQDLDTEVAKNAQNIMDQTNSGKILYQAFFNNCTDACQYMISESINVNLPLDLHPYPNSYFEKLKLDKNNIQNQYNILINRFEMNKINQQLELENKLLLENEIKEDIENGLAELGKLLINENDN